MGTNHAEKIRHRGRCVSLTASLLTLALLLPSCAANRAYKAGLRAERAERYADAIRHYSEAAARKPDEPRYRMALSNALMRSGEAHMERGEALERGGELELAYREYDMAWQETLLDHALLKRDILRKRLLAQAEGPGRPKEPPIQSPLDALPARPITLKMADCELTEVFSSIEKLTGILFIYDDTFKSRKVTVNMQQLTFRDALDRLMLMNHLFYRPIDSKTVLIAPENKREEYEELLLKTFFLHNSDPAKVAANIRSILEPKKMMVNQELKAITIKDSAERLELARRLIEKEDMRRAEVVVDMEILEFNRAKLQLYGLDLSSYAVGAAVALEPQTTFPSGSLIRGHMLGNIELSDILFSVPSVVYRLLRTDTRTRLIAKPQVRCAEGETAVVKVGERVGIAQTVFVPVAGGGVNNQPITSFVMTDVGLTIELTPTAYYNEEVALKLKFDLTNIIREGTVTQPPTLGNRSVTSTIRLKDGETTLIAGLIRDEERKSRSGLPGVSQIPVLGHLFASNQDGNARTDILVTLTPHIVRMAQVTEEERRGVWVGTEKTLRISDEPPPFAEVDKSQSPLVDETQPGAPPAQPRPPEGPPSALDKPPSAPPEKPRTENREPGTILFDPMEVVVPLGEEFSMQIRGQSLEPLARCSFTVVFDQALLTVVRIEPGERVAGNLKAEIAQGAARISFVSGKDFDGNVCNVVFTSKAPGPAQLLIDGSILTNASGASSKLSFVPASVHIAGERGSI
ncbi:MAG: hypothetical protein AB1714_08005 [Acidobacteriota bacterium]